MTRITWRRKLSEVAKLFRRHPWRPKDRVLILGKAEAEEIKWLAGRTQVVAVTHPDRVHMKRLAMELKQPQYLSQVLLVTAKETETPWLDETFDQVWIASGNVLDSETLWQECHRVLKPGGGVTALSKVQAPSEQDPTASLFFSGFTQLQAEAIPAWHRPELVVYRGMRERFA